MASRGNGHGARDALVEALAGRFAHHARQVRIDVAEQIRAAFRASGFTGPYLDAGHIVGTLPPGVGGLPPPAELVDDAAVVLLDDDGVVLVLEDGAAAADHTHPASGGMANPMTTLGDLITGGAAGAPGRLGVGTADQVLTVVAGVPAWRAPASTDNLLSNPGMEVWQRGAGPFTASTSFGPDRWALSVAPGGTLSVVRDTANADAGSLYCAAVTHVYGGIAGTRLFQAIEDVPQARGRVLTFAARVKCATASAARLSLYDSALGFRYSAYHTGGGAYETLTVTAVVAAGATVLQASLEMAASATAYLDAATLAAGSAALPYVPLHPAADLGRCQRYYQELGGLDNNEVVGPGLCFSATVAHIPLRLGTEMFGAPTVTVSAPGDWAVLDAGGTPVACTVLNPTLPTRRSVRLVVNVAAGLVAGNATTLKANNTLAARVRLESNPP